MADNKPAVLGGTAIKPVERHGWEAVRYLIHNPETGEYLTRTPKSWALIIVFYLIYYTCLAGFWAAMLAIFFQTIPDDQPKWLVKDSIIGESPGLGLRPKQLDANIDSSMIQFRTDVDKAAKDALIEGYGDWAERAKTFATDYATELAGSACHPDKLVDSFQKGQPCVFLKLNKIYDLQNRPYNDTALEAAGAPKSLVDHVKTQIAASNGDNVWVECHGQYPGDTEGLNSISYIPKSQGIPTATIYKKQADFKSPIVAVHFTSIPKNQLIHVECRAWAENIGYDKRDRIGINLFELHILDENSAKAVGN